MANLMDLKNDNVMKKIEIKELIKGEVAEQMADRANRQGDTPEAGLAKSASRNKGSQEPGSGPNVADSLGNLLKEHGKPSQDDAMADNEGKPTPTEMLSAQDKVDIGEILKHRLEEQNTKDEKRDSGKTAVSNHKPNGMQAGKTAIQEEKAGGEHIITEYQKAFSQAAEFKRQKDTEFRKRLNCYIAS